MSERALDHALALWRRGLSVIPVPLPDEHHDGKVPSIGWRKYQSLIPTEREIRTWFMRDQNIAVITGAVSGVVVIDADSDEAVKWIRQHLPYTPWQTQTARGFHLWYRAPDVPVRNRARIETRDGRLALDVRGDGGYVIGPSSVHASGFIYEYAGDWSVERDRLPRLWIGWLQRPERLVPKAMPPTRRPTADVIDRARRYLAAIPPPVIGFGSDATTLYAACRLVRGFGLNASDTATLLWEWAGNRPGWSHDWIACKVDHAIRYGTEPIGALR
jgi:hypothetical protein